MKPVIVAEISANHGGSLDTALELVEKCAKAGADAIKLQTWSPDKMVLDPTLVVQSGPWVGRNMMAMYREAHTPWEWHKPIFDLAKSKGMDAFSSVFDREALAFLEEIGCPRYKIASFECTDIPLIELVAATKKPMIISTGMATWDEIRMSYAAAKNTGCKDITMLKCTSAYPAPAASSNLRAMASMGDAFKDKVGFSDHTKGIGAAIAAVCWGAVMIEKHVMLPGTPSLDSGFSVTPSVLKVLVRGCKDAHDALGDHSTSFMPDKAEDAQRAMRRSWYVSKDLRKGDRLTFDNIVTARPEARGISPAEYPKLLNRKAKRTIKAGELLRWDMMLC